MIPLSVFGNISSIYFRASSLIAATPICASVAQSLTKELDAHFSNWRQNSDGGSLSTKFAVRSSAVGEDSEELSAAGQNQTFLGCRGEDRILEALAKCWGSLYAFQSVEYRR